MVACLADHVRQDFEIRQLRKQNDEIKDRADTLEKDRDHLLWVYMLACKRILRIEDSQK